MAREESRFTSYGWDKDSLFYPTDRLQGMLFGGIVALLILHFSEFLGVADTGYLIFGFFPLHFAYHVLHAILAILLIYILYRNWPEPEGK